MAYHLGIDAGSKTIKLVVLDEQGCLVFSQYRLHRSDIITTITELLRDTIWRFGNVEASVCVTGSAGMRLAELWQVEHVQEVVCTRYALRTLLPQANVAIELGGEDAKIIYLDGGAEMRMNGSCAGGTGGFIDLMTTLLGVSAREFNALAMGHQTIYPIASRCAVFAGTDVRPLLNGGARKSDIAASVLQAVVTQTIAGLSCGHPIQGNVAFLGGPFETYPALVMRFRQTLGLGRDQVIKPQDAHLFVAKGAALWGQRMLERSMRHHTTDTTGDSSSEIRVLSLQQLHDSAKAASTCTTAGIARLSPLFKDAAQQEDFKRRHAQCKVKRARLTDAKGPVFLGIDAGSTTLKMALIDAGGRLLYSAYENTAGDVLNTAKTMLEELYRSLPHEYGGDTLVHLGHATVTGYGEELLQCALCADSGVVETVAHLRAARELDPRVDFILDIGGQDIKCLRIKDGAIDDLLLNEACSSGCGALIEGFSRSLGYTKWSFSDIALEADSPVDLGTRCTVFMTSRVRHAQKEGIPAADIAAGLAYSVVRNALYKVIGCPDPAVLGRHVMVQGGTFKSDAVLRAFELESGLKVSRPDIVELMGAFGAALLARDRALVYRLPTKGRTWKHEYDRSGNGGRRGISNSDSSDRDRSGDSNGGDDRGRSGDSNGHVGFSNSRLLSPLELIGLRQSQSTRHCTACTNSCLLTENVFTNTGYDEIGTARNDQRAPHLLPHKPHSSTRRLISGNRCSCADTGATVQSARPNLLAYERKLLAHYDRVDKADRADRAGREDRAGRTPADTPADTTRNACTSTTGAKAAGTEAHVSMTAVDIRPLVGIPATMDGAESYPFWHTFFTHLGLRTRTILASDSHIYRKGAAHIASEGVCYPAKLTHGHVCSLIESGARFIFMPSGGAVARADTGIRFSLNDYSGTAADKAPETFSHTHQNSTIECPVSAHYARRIGEQITRSAGSVGFLTIDLSLEREVDEQLYRTLADCGLVEELGLSIERIRQALTAAAHEQERFYAKLAKRTQAVLDDLKKRGQQGIILAAPPYYVDPGLNHGVDTVLTGLGFAVISVSALMAWERLWPKSQQRDCPKDQQRGRPKDQQRDRPEDQQRGRPEDPVLFSPTVAANWTSARTLYRAARIAAANPQLELMHLYAFGCGVAALYAEQVRQIVEDAGKLYTALKLDEMVDIAAIRLRLRSMVAALQDRWRNGYDVAVQEPEPSDAWQGVAVQESEPSGAWRSSSFRREKRPHTTAQFGSEGEAAQSKQPGTTAQPSEQDEATPKRSGTATQRALSPTIIMPALAPNKLRAVSAVVCEAGFNLNVLSEFTQQDVEAGLSFCNHDLCYPMIATTGQVIAYLKSQANSAASLDDDTIETTLLMPQSCCGCRATEMERIIRQHCKFANYNSNIKVRGIPSSSEGFVVPAWLATRIYTVLDEGSPLVAYRPGGSSVPDGSDGPGAGITAGADNSARDMPDAGRDMCGTLSTDGGIDRNSWPKIGVVANAALLYTPQLNNGILDGICAQGFVPYIPNITRLLTTNAPLESLVEEYAKEGIRDIICLQSFACLNGHIHGRGAVQGLTQRYPELTLSFIDYDPGAAKLNQDSRLKLALSVAQEHWQEQHKPC
ncbi:MAG: acyl-CoA dehydratase activase-related protein [Coriobacteriales bacterium]|jgi:predicted CoA-substrate-specific enzyme activase|nr:acyl-CoA dehydratase activase-related protein [Coriobacteriales bacterium]